MELVYLWVEEYKNIKNQGFNFSPRFECEFFPKYDKDEKLEDNCDLKITPKDYVSIFPGNINVTAIVGGNGSGKSSILNYLCEYMFYMENKGIILFYINGKFYSIGNYKIKDVIIINNNIKRRNEYFNIFTHTSDFLNSELFLDREIFIYKDINPMSISTVDANNLSDKFPILNLSYSNYYSYTNGLLLKMFANIKSELFVPNEFYINYSTNFLIYKLLDILTYYRAHEYQELEIKCKEYIDKLFKKELDYVIYFYYYITQYNNSYDGNYKKFVENFYKEEFPNEVEYQNLSKLKELEELKIITNKKNEWISLDDEIKDSINNLVKDESFFNMIFNLFDFNFREKERLFSELSTGEKNLLLIESLLLKNIDFDKPTLILLDEIDDSYHPNWNKNIINNLIQILSKNNIHIIITSHSPFILSDIPKENVIFLDKYKENDEEVKKDIQKLGNCKNVSKDLELKTFGANIHTLLSNGFFMSDGLMGEFAKSKINEIKKFYELIKKCEKIINNSEKVKNTIKNIYQGYEPNFRNIQNIIGEPFLQTIIKNYLDELEILFNGKKEFLDNEIKRLEELRNEIK